VAGCLSFMSAAFRQLEIPIPVPDDYPAALAEHLHRPIRQATAGELRDSLRFGGRPVFAKPRLDRKKFTGQVFSYGDERNLQKLYRSFELWCSPPVKFVSELRVFVVNGEIVGMRHYDGDTSVSPDMHVIEDCVTATGSRLAGYAFDVGVLESGVTALVEFNEEFSIGGYGLTAGPLVDVLFARWTQLRSESPVSAV
jgi:hypothetical protein